MQDTAVGEFFDSGRLQGAALRLPNQIIDVGFFSMWLFVGLVSAYDAWLVVKYWDSILEFERNPVCSYFITLGDGNWDLFLRAKTSGTLAVLSVLIGLYRRNRRLALPVAGALSGFQLALLVYLTVH
ncbi:MAG TPA: hypothetical protein VHC22_13800 [Pirellulales bacterium]|nr:hypothetical protein [Pirellulales bacterium]